MATSKGYAKPLININCDYGRTVVIDDSPVAYRHNPENALPIPPWTQKQHRDRCLLELLPKIANLRDSVDIREDLAKFKKAL